MFDNLTFKDGMFIVLASFFLLVIVASFITLPKIGWKRVVYLIELYVIILIIFMLGYNYLKEQNNASYLTQERLMFGLIALIVLIMVIVISIEIFSMRKTTHGFLIFVASIVFVIIVIMGVLANSALNNRYGLHFQDPMARFEVGTYGRLAESYTD